MRAIEEIEADITLDLVFDGRVAYCSADCKSEHEAEVAARNVRFEEFRVRVLAAKPGVTFTEFTGGYPWCGNKGLFTFPGAQYDGSVTDAEESTELKWYIAQRDKAAWDYFSAEHEVF
ncbi:hypothetical protein [Pseudomonas sp. R4-34-07]|uniref:hypothetical protein n=1 Tax=Pseudomonas sp. R4-34-07 TaxID=658642 RepID=UPI002114B499|nr:hypothetical protein [Pseudomonas sp. R4-34-07]